MGVIWVKKILVYMCLNKPTKPGGYEYVCSFWTLVSMSMNMHLENRYAYVYKKIRLVPASLSTLSALLFSLSFHSWYAVLSFSVLIGLIFTYFNENAFISMIQSFKCMYYILNIKKLKNYFKFWSRSWVLNKANFTVSLEKRKDIYASFMSTFLRVKWIIP